jgi:uncharacterized membrane protein HdeD (DUF308 family)
MSKSTSTSLILIGILAVIIGIVAIAWPGVTILALVILVAAWAFAGGVAEVRQIGAGAAPLAEELRHHS